MMKLDHSYLRNSAEFGPLKSECQRYAAFGGVVGGASGYGLARLAGRRSTAAMAAAVVLGTLTSRLLYSKLEDDKLNDFRVRKVAEHYQYMRPIFAPTVLALDGIEG